MKISKNGISLIVLVITIIVMIILATAIILSLNSNNIVGKANEARNSSDVANRKEAASVYLAEYEIKKAKGTIDSSTISSEDYVKEQFKKAGLDESDLVITEEGEIIIGTPDKKIYKDKNEDIAIIPEGFSVSKVASEQTVENGLVIIDKDGNEFVWVPVHDMNLFKRTTTYTGTITAPSSDYTEPYSALSLSNDPTGEVAEYNAMYESVKEYKGFYIARYEAGLPEGKTTSTLTSTDKPVSKKGMAVWNYIPWGTSMTEVGTEGAVYRARQMYKGSKSVVSTLCYGVQWNAALQFIATNEEHKEYPTNSTGKGNYIGNLLKTGSRNDYEVNNIYDMAGNVFEWTMEARSTDDRVNRGGCYGNLGSNTPASYCNNYDPESSNDFCGFRLTLYIK